MENDSVRPDSFEGLSRQSAADETRTIKSLAALHARYFDLYDLAPVSYFTLNNLGAIHEVNLAAVQLFGMEKSALAGQFLTSLIHPADQDIYHRGFQMVMANGLAHQCELRMLNSRGAAFWACLDMDVGVSADGESVRRIVLFDISKRKSHETRKAFLSTILGILNEPLDVKETIVRILKAIKRETGFDAVGIRLHSGSDYPYFVSDGFSEEFISRENDLVSRAADGSICFEKNGSPCLECTCGMVIAGKYDPVNSSVTPGKSFWTNNARLLLDIPAHEDPRLNPRNICILEGFHSIALIPIFSDRKILGLLQLNDREKDRLTLDMVDFLEEVADSIGVALKRKNIEDQLRLNEERQQLILHSTVEAITKRRQAEADLRISEGRYRSVVEDQTELICRYRPDGKMSFVNEAYARYYEKSVAELIGRNFVPDIPAPDLQMISDRLAAIDPESPVAIFEHRIITPHGEERWQRWTHRKIFGLNGRLIESQATGADITDRRRAEEALKASLRQIENEKLRTQAIIAMIGDGISIQDPEFRITYQNEAHIRSMGRHAGEYCYEAYEQQDRICPDCPLALTFRDGETHRSERTVVNNGIPRYFEVVTSPLKDADGHVIAGIEAVRENTERRQLEEMLVERVAALNRITAAHVELEDQLKQTNDDLEHRVVERTAELTSAQEAMIDSMAILAEFRDTETGAHIQRTKQYVKILLDSGGKDFPYSAREKELVYLSAPLHDIGKVAIPDGLLFKPGKLSKEEFELMKKHASYGFETLCRAERMLGENSFFKFAKEITKYHHEKWNGTGYPDGLKECAIPLSARLLMIADTYDAIVSTRPYKRALSHESAVKVIRDGAGIHFDPRIVSLFLKGHECFKRIHEEIID